ncbi:SnoaL-like domain-containing protein [Geodermatophilus telluris]|uniref:SnoaL-like domain-containing protein n=1 Tax=Geodermatophilus telluris TaxID=1190417 RepID=A0A1G6TG97_9ACTN|nr:nuclear transport factor 2 family protein [Geodermatophilus telluris]SDD27536.1 SnoaL-like domain-containing protein [Geodermatophilus telluris]
MTTDPSPTADPSAPDRAARLRALYRAFTARDLDAVLAAMSPDVDWPNGWEGGRVHGHDGVRAYWERQWAQIRPLLRPTGVQERPDGSVAVTVAMTVRDPGGTVLSRETVRHVYRFAGDLVRRMDVER